MATFHSECPLNPSAYIFAPKRVLHCLTAGKVILALLFLFIALVIQRLVYAFYLSPLRKLPGPLLGKLTSLRIELSLARGLITKTGNEDVANYGDLYMCMPNAVTVSDPDDIRSVLGNSAVKKAYYYKSVRFTGIETTLSMQDNKDAGVRHRQIAPYFQNRHLAKMQGIIMDQGIHSIKRRWDRLLKESPTGMVEVNYCDDILLSSFGVVSRLVFGRTIDEIKSTDAASAKWIERTFKLIGIRTMIQMLPPLLAKALFWPWEHYFTKISGCAHEAITARKELMVALEKAGKSDQKPVDLLQALIDAEDSETNTMMSYDEIHAECMLMMLAGSDTTGFAIIWAVHMLMLHPHYYKRAVEEVRSLYSQDHTITYNECRETLPFVEACVFETLRMFPIIGGMLSRVSPKGGINIQGQLIPEDTLIFINMARANYHSKYWDRPYEFDPFRFIKDKEASRNLLSFSYGRRICPGRHLAWWEMLTTFPNLLKDYDFRLPDDCAHLGPNILDERGQPKKMSARSLISYKPSNAERDCRLIISKASPAK